MTATAFEDARIRRETAKADLAELEVESRRPRLTDPERIGKPRRGPGVVLAHISDEQIIALIDAGLTRVEIAEYFGVGDHIIRYRLRVMRERRVLPETTIPYGKFFTDDLCDEIGYRRYYMVPAHRREAWNALKGIKASLRPDVPAWATPLSDPSLVEFSLPKNVGGFVHGGDL